MWGFFAVFGGMGGTASPTARSHLRSPTVAPPEPHRSTSDLNQRYYGEAPARVRRDSHASSRHSASAWLMELRLPRREERLTFGAGLRFDLRCGTKWHSSWL